MALLSTKNNASSPNHTKSQLSSQQANVSNTLPDVETSQSSSLGTIANLASDAQKRNKNARDEATIKRFKLQSQARKELPAKRVANCLRLPVPNSESVDIVRIPSRDAAHFHNLQTCDSAWDCPVCASKLSERRRAEVLRGMVLALEHGLVPVLLTFTLSHHKWDTLEYLKIGLKSALKKFKEGRAFQMIKEEYGWTGSIMSIEATSGYKSAMDNGWHIHRHDLVFIEPMSLEKYRQFEVDVKTHWLHCLEFLGYSASWEHGLDVTDSDTAVTDYITKWGHEPADETWGVTHELTKSSSKKASAHGVTPFQLLELASAGDAHAGALFREYSAAMAGTSLIRWSRGFRAFLGMDEELTDTEILAVEDEPQETVISMTKPTWYQLMNRSDDTRADLLILARTGDAAALEKYIVSLVPDADFFREKVEKEGIPMTSKCPHCDGETKYLRVVIDADQQAAAEFWCRECAVSSFTYDLTSAQVVDAALVYDALSAKREPPAREVAVEEQLRLFEPRVQFWS